MALKYDYVALRTQFLEAEPRISINELCRRNDIDITKAPTIAKRAKDEDWLGLREKRETKTADIVVQQISEREARRILRRMEVEDNAIDGIDEAVTKMRADMKRLKWEKNPKTQEYEQVPAVIMRPSEVVQLIDRLKGLFGDFGPASAIPDVPSGDPQLAARFNFNFDGDSPEHRALAAQLVSATRGAVGPVKRAGGGSPLPDAPGAGDDE